MGKFLLVLIYPPAPAFRDVPEGRGRWVTLPTSPGGVEGGVKGVCLGVYLLATWGGKGGYPLAPQGLRVAHTTYNISD